LLAIQTGNYVVVKSKAVILATGAGPLMYQRSACAQEKAMDGIGMAYRAGARLMDMEMVQFHPTGLVVPGSLLNGTLLEEGLRGAGARLFNGQGERYMQRYDAERMERSTRDRVSRAGFLEIQAGRGTPDGGVWIDVSHLGAEFVEQNFAGMRERCLRLGADLAREKVEVCPTAHFNMGGVRINKDGFTNLQGLFAAGEDASGVHGANRLGGNGVAESTVFGARVGEAVARWVKTESQGDLNMEQAKAGIAAADHFLDLKGDNPWDLRESLGKIMWENVGIVREGARMRLALEEIKSLQDRAAKVSAPGGRRFNLTWQQALDMRNLLTASELITRSALERQESRGAHYREDFPATNDAEWLKNIYIARHGEGPRLWSENVKLERLKPT
jgi:succinate dehydrogenase/fumarate reductase flavoprotein subunit